MSDSETEKTVWHFYSVFKLMVSTINVLYIIYIEKSDTQNLVLGIGTR